MRKKRHILGKIESRRKKLEKLAPFEPRRVEKMRSGRLKEVDPGIKICPNCQDEIFFKKKWFQRENLKKHLQKRLKGLGITFKKWLEEQKKLSSLKKERAKRKKILFFCPKCRQHKDWCEGVVYLQGLSSQIKREVLNLVKNMDKEAQRRDPEDRILKIEDKGDEVIIFTSENQLAHRIGNKVERSFKGGKLEIKFSHQEEGIRVFWQAPSKS